jgi:hypothetical protein
MMRMMMMLKMTMMDITPPHCRSAAEDEAMRITLTRRMD